MANLKSSQKDVRRIARRNEANSQKRAALRTAHKKLVKTIESGNEQEAIALYRYYTKVIDTAARKGLVKKNMASRHKSRLALRIKKIAAAPTA